MLSKLEDDIGQYIHHFQSEHDKLRKLPDKLHRKLLVVTMLGALAEGRYPKNRYPKARDAEKFVNLVEEHSEWVHATSVSASQLEMRIKKLGGANALGLSSDFIEKLRAADWRKPHNQSEIVGLGEDPKAEDVLPTFPNKEERKLVDEVKHSSLLYRYRCTLVHEYREPGHGFEFDQSSSVPFYHTMMNMPDRHETTELVYPTNWFLELVPPILTRLKTYYIEERVNPYDSYEFGSPWR